MQLTYKLLITWVLTVLLCGCTGIATTETTDIESYSAYKKQTLTRLDTVISRKKKELIQYLQITEKNAAEITTDALMVNFFKSQHALNQLKDTANLNAAIKAKNTKVKKAVKQLYIQKYQRFYDILMVDTNGNIFYTIRKEKDYHKNIFKGNLAQTKISKKLQQNPRQSFVDFQFYDISGIPSAFFIEPIFDKTDHIGWIVLQFSIEKINRIFSLDSSLGTTGETILVNKSQYMLTNSRFNPKSTIFQKKLSYKNISTKFAAKKGYKSVIDYRGFKVLSAFEVFQFYESEWLIIAKINEAEVLTNYYKNSPEKLEKCFIQALDTQKHQLNKQQLPEADIDVNIDEFKRSEHQTLYTHGISTCSGLVITLPFRFSYMAHISPYDKLYGRRRTDITGHLINRIKYLEVTQAEQQLLKFTLVATHQNTAIPLIKRLINSGFALNQIKIVIYKKAKHADIYHLPQKNKTVVCWKTHQGICKTELAETTPNVSQMVCLH